MEICISYHSYIDMCIFMVYYYDLLCIFMNLRCMTHVEHVWSRGTFGPGSIKVERSLTRPQLEDQRNKTITTLKWYKHRGQCTNHVIERLWICCVNLLFPGGQVADVHDLYIFISIQFIEVLNIHY